MKEQVLAFDEGFMEGFIDLPGFSKNQLDINRFYDIVRKNCNWYEKESVEEDTTKKQIIPYTIVLNPSTNKILAYKRTKKGGENRLYDKWSIGVGGHINQHDQTLCIHPIYISAMRRELREEIDLEIDPSNTYYNFEGLIYDNSNPVGRVHFGAVIVVLTKRENLASNEDAIDKDLKWVTPKEALELPNLENWSQMVAKGLLNE